MHLETVTRPRASAAPAPLPPAVARYLQHLAVNGMAKGTIARYREALVLFLRHIGQAAPQTIKVEQVANFLATARLRRSGATVNGMKSALRGFFGHLLDTDEIVKDPTRLVRNERVVRKSPKVFSSQDLKQLLGTIEKEIGNPPRLDVIRDWALYSLAYHDGLRVGELVRTNVDDVEDRQTLELIGKGNKRALLPISQRMRAILRRYLELRKSTTASDPRALFLNRFGTRLSTVSVERNLKKWLKRAGLDTQLTPHSLRHTFGTHVLQRTGNIRTAQEMLRHQDLATTQIYTHISSAEMRAAAEALG